MCPSRGRERTETVEDVLGGDKRKGKEGRSEKKIGAKERAVYGRAEQEVGAI